jgi:hypothetical protein
MIMRARMPWRICLVSIEPCLAWKSMELVPDALSVRECYGDACELRDWIESLRRFIILMQALATTLFPSLNMTVTMAYSSR